MYLSLSHDQRMANVSSVINLSFLVLQLQGHAGKFSQKRKVEKCFLVWKFMRINLFTSKTYYKVFLSGEIYEDPSFHFTDILQCVSECRNL